MILIVDDDRAVRASLNLLLKKAGYETAEAADPDEALAAIREMPPALCLLDMNFSRATTGEEGLRLLENIKQINPGLPVILITAWGSISLAVAGMKLGASDFITKPWNNDFLLGAVRTILELAKEKGGPQPITYDRSRLDQIYHFENIVGTDEKLLQVLGTAGSVSATDAAVLILGESGTGKELVAEAIHANSRRRRGPFIKVNLGGIPPDLFESEMFGHKKGAFTGAVEDRLGRFEMANGGTIFLDEIGDLDLAGQVKLLRVLQDRSFEALGTSTTRYVDFRLISATNRNLEEIIRQGSFREDLYYRINLISLQLPSLRERRPDIPLLAQHFMNNMKLLYGRPALKASSAALNWLSSQPWAGNVRELKNLVERTILLTPHDDLEISDFQIHCRTLSQSLASADLTSPADFTLENMEKAMIMKAMRLHHGNLSKVATSLGLSRGALYRRLEKHGISHENPQ